MRLMRASVIALMLLAIGTVVQAQTVTNVTGTMGISFTDVDQNATAADGTPLISKYEMRFTPAVPASCAAAPPANLGKPVADATGTINAKPVPAFGTLPANCIYTLVIAAMGPGGEGVSVSSDPFARVVVRAPGASSKPVILP